MPYIPIAVDFLACSRWLDMAAGETPAPRFAILLHGYGSNDHPSGDGFVGAGVDEDEGAGAAVASVGIMDERQGFSGSK